MFVRFICVQEYSYRSLITVAEYSILLNMLQFTCLPGDEYVCCFPLTLYPLISLIVAAIDILTRFSLSTGASAFPR